MPRRTGLRDVFRSAPASSPSWRPPFTLKSVVGCAVFALAWGCRPSASSERSVNAEEGRLAASAAPASLASAPLADAAPQQAGSWPPAPDCQRTSPSLFHFLSWFEAYDFIKKSSPVWPNEPSPKTPEEAMRALCLESSSSFDLPPVRQPGGCSGDVWKISTHVQHQHTFVHGLFPRGDHVLVFSGEYVGGQNRGSEWSLQVRNNQAWVRFEHTELEQDEESGEWRPAPTQRYASAYDFVSGQSCTIDESDPVENER